ncbi:hypothetical protein HEP87_64155 [Streptomyces sp. S1D4-11]
MSWGVVSGPRDARRAVAAPERGRWSGVSCATVFHRTTPRAASRTADERGGQVAVAEGEDGGLDPAGGDQFGAGALLDGGAQGGQEPLPGQAYGGGRGGGGRVVGQGGVQARDGRVRRQGAVGGGVLERGTQPGHQEGEPDVVRAAQEPPAVPRQQLAADAA